MNPGEGNRRHLNLDNTHAFLAQPWWVTLAALFVGGDTARGELLHSDRDRRSRGGVPLPHRW
jgi:hypothetical protein